MAKKRPSLIEHQPCSGCPFKGMTLAEKKEAMEPGTGNPPVMFCHESYCLDGDEPDRVCYGFYQRSKPPDS